jgi:glycosyltransferase involved in cell wall biosynthesis
MRCHKEERLPFLEEALFSLAIQYWQDIEVVIVLQNGTQEFRRSVFKIINKQPWQGNPQFQVLTVEIPIGIDGRSTLLNHGMQRAIGRYLAFLDDDDVVYQHGYSTLIEQLSDSQATVAVGGCRTARTVKESDYWYIQTKETPFIWGRTRYDLFRDNFIPIHSYVVDRARIDSSELYFDDEFPPLEDYDFLLRLSAQHEFDFSKINVFVCEYRIHDANSIPYTTAAPTEAYTKHAHARELIEQRKNNLLCTVPLKDLTGMQETLIRQEPQQLVTTQSHLTAGIDELTENEESRVFKKFLDSVGDKVYTFFERHPRIERKLSDITHYGWRTYNKRKTMRH